MTDNELIKALECCLLSNEQQEERCAECPMCETPLTVCQHLLSYHALDLIKRYEAEIERLNEYIGRCKSGEEYWVKCLLERPNETIKEVLERLNKEAEKVCIDREGDFVEADGEIYDTVADWCKKTSDKLLEEMVGEE